MQKNNQLTKKQQGIFIRAGWIIHEITEPNPPLKNDTVQMVVITFLKECLTKTIQIDYKNNALTVVENDVRSKLAPRVKYDARMPEMIDDTLKILEIMQTIDKLLLNRLYNEN